jgi:hypothetical protein
VEATLSTPWVGATDSNKVVDGGGGNTVSNADTGRLQGQAPLVGTLDGSIVILGDLVGSNNNDDLLGIISEGSCSSKNKIGAVSMNQVIVEST